VDRLQKEDHIIEVLKELRNDQNRAQKSFQHTLRPPLDDVSRSTKKIGYSQKIRFGH